MKKGSVILTATILLSIPVQLCSKEDPLILEIRKRFNFIESHLKSCLKKEAEMEEGDPSTLIGYFRERELLKIYFQTGDNLENSEESYYFQKGELIFLYITTVCHPQVPGNMCQNEKTDDRYYFHNGRLIRWLNTNRRKISGNQPGFKKKEKELLKRAHSFVKKL